MLEFKCKHCGVIFDACDTSWLYEVDKSKPYWFVFACPECKKVTKITVESKKQMVEK